MTNLKDIIVNVRLGRGKRPGWYTGGRHYKAKIETPAFEWTIDYWAETLEHPSPMQVLETFLKDALVGQVEDRRAPANTCRDCGQAAQLCNAMRIDPFDTLVEMGVKL